MILPLKTAKPCLTPRQQVERLRDVHNMTISDEPALEWLFSTYNYYHVLGYTIPKRKPSDKDDYSDITDSGLIDSFHFDKKFRALCFCLIGEVELRLRRAISYQHSSSYGPYGYLDAAKFSNIGALYHQEFIEKFQNRKAKIKESFIAHHDKEYLNMPLWVAIELLDLSDLSRLFNILYDKDQQEVRKLLDTCSDLSYKMIGLPVAAKNSELANYMNLISCLRNRICHQNSLMNRHERVKISYYYCHHVNGMLRNSSFAAFYASLILCGNKRLATEVVGGLIALSSEHRFADLSCWGFPTGWVAILQDLVK